MTGRPHGFRQDVLQPHSVLSNENEIQTQEVHRHLEMFLEVPEHLLTDLEALHRLLQFLPALADEGSDVAKGIAS